MFLTFPLLLAAGAGSRLALSQTLKRRYGVALEIPQVLAIGLIVLAVLPSWASPLTLPLPLAFVLGAVLPEALRGDAERAPYPSNSPSLPRILKQSPGGPHDSHS